MTEIPLRFDETKHPELLKYAAVELRQPHGIGSPFIHGTGVVGTADSDYGSRIELLCLVPKAPPEPVYRAWADRSEVPYDLRFLRHVSKRPATWYAVQCLLSTNAITMAGGYLVSFDDLLDGWEWSLDGREWRKCGVPVSPNQETH